MKEKYVLHYNSFEMLLLKTTQFISNNVASNDYTQNNEDTDDELSMMMKFMINTFCR